MQTLIAKVEDTGDGMIVLKQPVQVVMQPMKDGRSGMGFIPFLEYSDEFVTGIKISNEEILTINTPMVELENQYNQIFGSGIQIASASSII